jgi:hypothetical protein
MWCLMCYLEIKAFISDTCYSFVNLMQQTGLHEMLGISSEMKGDRKAHQHWSRY